MPLSLRFTSVVSLFGLLFALNSCRHYLENLSGIPGIVILLQKDPGIAQGRIADTEVHSVPAHDLVRSNGGQTLDKGMVVQVRVIDFEKGPCH